MLADAHIRIARPTDNIAALLPFYREGLGFEVIGSFEDHQGFDGIMLGHPQASYHLEFTHHRGHLVGKSPMQEHLLVFYLPDPQQWTQAVERMEKAGFAPVLSYNPYWMGVARPLRMQMATESCYNKPPGDSRTPLLCGSRRSILESTILLCLLSVQRTGLKMWLSSPA